MGWADCGKDSRGRNIGYAFAARCDHPGCHVRIDRGLSYACGDMHGEDEISCEGYFCYKHRAHYVERQDGSTNQVCASCFKLLKKAAKARDGWRYDKDEDIVIEQSVSSAAAHEDSKEKP